MTMQLVHIPQPFAPHVGTQFLAVEDGETIGSAIARSEWKLRPNVVLLKPGLSLERVDWQTARMADVLVKRKEWDALTLEDGQSAVLVSMPGSAGGGNSNPIGVIAQLALLVAASVLAPGIGTFLAGTLGIGLNAAQALAASTILVGGKLLISAILPSPGKGGQKSASPTYSLNGQTNQARLGAPVPELFGKFNIVCDLAAYPWSDYNGNDQHLCQLFVVGRGSYLINELRLGNNVFARDNGAGVLVSTGSYPEIQWQVIPPGGSVTLFPNNVFTSTEVSSIELMGPNEADYGWTAWFTTNPQNTVTNLISVDIALPSGLLHTDSDGDAHRAEVSFAFQLQEIDDSGNTIGDPFDALSIDLKMQTPTPQRISYDIKVPSGRYIIRGQRTNNKSLGGQTQDALMWLALRSRLPPMQNLGDVTLVALRNIATKNVNSSSTEQFNVTATRKLPIYDTVTKTWSAPTATRSITWAVAYIARKRFADSAIDLDMLVQYGNLWFTRGDFFDGVFDTEITFWNGLITLLSAGRAQPILSFGKLTFVRDEPKTIYRTGFSPVNMQPGSFQRNHQYFTANDVDALVVPYVDSRDWKQHSVLCKLAGSAATKDTAPSLPLMIGITDYAHAWREGIFKVASSRYRRIFPTFSTELAGRICFRGDKIKLAHWSANYGASALILDLEPDDAGDILTLSEPWNLVLDSDGAKIVLLTAPAGRTAGPVPVDVIDDGATSTRARVRLLDSAAPDAGKYAGLEPRDWDIWSFSEDADRGLQLRRPQAQMGQGTQAPQDAIVVSMTPSQNKQAQLSTVIDDPRVHTADEGDPPAEDDPPELDDVVDIQITSLDVEDGGPLHGYTITVNGASDGTSFEYRRRAVGAPDWSVVTVGQPNPFDIDNSGGNALQVRARNGTTTGYWFDTILTET